MAHLPPTAKRCNIYSWVRQRKLAKPQLRALSQQTGLSMGSVEVLLEQGDWEKLLKLQEAQYSPVTIKSVKTTPLTISEYLVDADGRCVKGADIVNIQEGDILITKNSRFLGWRNGHAGIVVDAEKGLVLEAVMLGTNTRLCSVESWEEYPSFLVLRLREERKDAGSYAQKAADYAMENLVDIPYHLLAGVGEKLFPAKGASVHATEAEKVAESALNGTQCAHLVWYAYKQVGIDLDSDGGLLVTPYDIQNSPYLEVVQSYGY